MPRKGSLAADLADRFGGDLAFDVAFDRLGIIGLGVARLVDLDLDERRGLGALALGDDRIRFDLGGVVRGVDAGALVFAVGAQAARARARPAAAAAAAGRATRVRREIGTTGSGAKTMSPPSETSKATQRSWSLSSSAAASRSVIDDRS